ncbi:MAG: outer membrane beta-barrel protein [Chthoniobacteraceae bacterium]
MRLLPSRTTVFSVVCAGLGVLGALRVLAQTEVPPEPPPLEPPSPPALEPPLEPSAGELPLDRETGTLPPDFIGPIEPVLPPENAGPIEPPTRPAPAPAPARPGTPPSEEPPIEELPLEIVPGSLISPTPISPLTAPYGPSFTGIGDSALTRVLDRSASAFGPNALGGIGGIRGFGGIGGIGGIGGAQGSGLLGRARKPRINLRPLAIDGSVTFSGIAEKGGSSSSSNSNSWEPSFRVSPSITAVLGPADYGRYLALDYALSTGWGKGTSQDGKFDQAFSGEAFYAFSKLQLSLVGDFSRSSGIDRDVGGNANRDSYAAAFSASYPLSAKTSLAWTTSGTVDNVEGGINSTGLNTGLTLSRQFTFKSRLGISASVGSLSTDDAADDQIYEQINLLWSYLATPKLSFAWSVGYQFRQIGSETSGTPIFSGSIAYQVRERTSVGLAAARTISNSASQSQTNYTSNTVALSISQQIGDRAAANLAIGYQGAAYDSTTTGESTGRNDHYYYVRPSLAFRVAQRLSLSVYYSYGKNQSDESPFATQQVGINATVPF